MARHRAEELATVHLYYNDTELYSCTAHVVGQWEMEMNGEARKILILDQTVMHSQGGNHTVTPGLKIYWGDLIWRVKYMQSEYLGW